MQLDIPCVESSCPDAEKQEGPSRALTDSLPEFSLQTSMCCTSLVREILHYLGRMTRCSVSGFFLVDRSHGQMGLYCSRPVDELFLRSMQKRLVSSYQACIGPGTVEPEVKVTVYGDTLPGPYELPRSLLTAPVLNEGRVIGLVAVASVFVEAFSSQDLCTLSTVAAQVPGMLVQSSATADQGCQGDACDAVRLLSAQSDLAQERIEAKVRRYVASICGLAGLWQTQSEGELPAVLRRDLDAIISNAHQIRELLGR